MSFGDRTYDMPFGLPKWLKDFADSEMNKKATSPMENIQDILFEKGSVENMVKKLRERVGLDLVTGKEAFDNEKKARRSVPDHLPNGLADHKRDSNFDPEQLTMGIGIEMEHTDDEEIAKEIAKDHLIEDPKYYTHLVEMEEKYKNASKRINQLVIFANNLEEMGDLKSAKKIDELIKSIFEEFKEIGEKLEKEDKKEEDKKEEDKKEEDKKEEEKELKIFKEFPQIKKFIDNVCQSREGFVNTPSILKMLKDERQEDIDITDSDLKDYIENKIKEEKKELPDNDDDIAGKGTFTVFFVTEEDDGNKKVFDEPTKL